MRELICRRLAGSSLPTDAVAEAERQIPAAARHVWFHLPLRPAAVLLPLVERNGVISLLLTERTHEIPEHPGQVAFPGGRAEAGDRDLVHTALRESEEEIGLPPAAVELVGIIRCQPVISGYAVLPVVGFIRQPFEPVLDRREVGDLFEVPLSFFMDDANGRRFEREREGVPAEVWEYWWEHHRVWGATAKIVREFVAHLK